MKNSYLTPLLLQGKELKDRYLQTFSPLSSEQLNWKPTANSWSVGQCLDHIVISNKLYINILRSVAERTKNPNFFEKIPLLPAFFGKMIIRSLQPENLKPTKTFQVFEPSQSNIPDSILEQFATVQDELLGLMKNLDGFDHQREIVTSPLSRLVTYSLKDACTIVIIHEERHYNQAVRVMKEKNFPSG